MDRIIFHIDVNNAFLSWTAVKLLNNGYKEDIRLIPSCIGGSEEHRSGIVLAKSPVAKKYGVTSAETLYQAKKKCPNLQVFPPDFEWYHECSNNFINYLKNYSPELEQVSIDECFMDFTNTKYLYKDYVELAYHIKDEIYSKFGFTVNVGIANNKLCAKMASDFEKPNKVHTLFKDEVVTKMYPLPIEDLLFVGKSTSTLLRNLNINTIGELANADLNLLNRYFKNMGNELINRAKGIDDSIVNPIRSQSKSISSTRTLLQDTSNLEYIKEELLDISNRVALEARLKGLYASSIAIIIKTSKFVSFSHQKTLLNPTNNTMVIYNTVLELLNEENLKDEIRLLGIRLGNLSDIKTEQINIFSKKTDSSKDKIQEIMDNINLKYDKTKIMPAIFYNKKK